MSFEQVLETVKSAHSMYIKKDDVLVVAVSTGVDSMVLIEALQTLNTQLHVIHFNHHKREQSKEEALFIHQYCEKRLITYSEFNVPEFSQNFQGNARDFRHEQLCNIAKQYAQGVIVTAHHFDDQVETYIQRIFSGSSILNRKTMSIHEQRGNQRYFRPLVSISKEIIRQAAKQENIQYFEDESNKENTYLRNKIRNKIVPLIESVFPTYRKTLANDFLEIAEMNDYFQNKYEQFFQDNIAIETNKIMINKENLVKEHYYFQNIVIEHVLKQLEIVLKRQRYMDIRTMLLRPKGQIQLKRDVIFKVDEKVVSIEKKHTKKLKIIKKEFFLTDGLQKLPKQQDLCYNNGYTSCQDILEIEATDLPFLRVRCYRTGDKIEIGDHHKLVRRLFIDQKLPREKREYYPLVEDVRTNKIIWIPTMYKAKSTKAIKKECRIQIYFNDGGFYA